MIEAIQNRLLNETVRINSYRFVSELLTFEFNATTRKAEARKGKHDDAIMAMGMALYVRDSMLRDIPMGADVPLEVTASFKTQMYEEIKRELMNGAPENIMEEEMDFLAPDKESIMPGIVFGNNRRAFDKILKEFNWSYLIAIPLLGSFI